MTRSDAVFNLFVAFGAQRNAEQAKLYIDELTRGNACGDCAELAVKNLMRSAKRLPPLSSVLAEALEVMGSDAHAPHIVRPLAPKSETFWRAEATKIILPKVDGDRDLAAFVAASLWWSDVPPDLDRIAEELEEGIWIEGCRRYAEGKDTAALAEAAFRRARWAHEHHPSETMPAGVLELVIT
jgi:hypothetical protein